jgi:hypothetical protein
MLDRQTKEMKCRFLAVTEEMDIGYEPRWYQSVSRPLLVIVSRPFGRVGIMLLGVSFVARPS